MSIFDIFKPIQSRVRMFFRRRMLPMTVDEAEEKREFFAKLYFISSFSLFTFLLYSGFQKTHTADRTVPIAETTIENLKIDGKVRIMRYEGLKKVDDYFYERKKKNEAENENPDPELIADPAANGN